MKKIPFYILVILTIVSVVSCKKESNAPDNITRPIVLPANGASVIKANNQFAFNFLHATLLQDNTDNNKLISPLSIYLALSMAYNGANNGTKDSMAKALQLSGIDINDVNAICNLLITQLPQEDSKIKFSIANSIWYNKNFQPLTSFLNVVQDSYKASVQSLNFNDATSAKIINDWAAQKTNNKIKQIIDHVSPGDLMYLINAIYFNGAWQYAFPSSNTHNEDFYLQDGSVKSTQFMEQKLTVNFYNDSLFTLIELPYGGGKSCSMYIALPNNQDQTVNNFASSISEKILENAIGKMYPASIEVVMPKWEYAYNMNMKPELVMLGMGNAFTNNADFSKMYNPAQVTPYITQAIHKTYIKVNEEGTEAAAVTTISVGTTAAGPVIVKINHPFLYTIIEKQTGSIVFTGIVNDPSGN